MYKHDYSTNQSIMTDVNGGNLEKQAESDHRFKRPEIIDIRTNPNGAAIDGEHRYALWRQWDTQQPLLMFIMLNPSTADAETDDATIRRCQRFAWLNNFGGILVGNLYAYRATKPAILLKQPLPIRIGSLNDDYLLVMHNMATSTVVAWGTLALTTG